MKTRKHRQSYRHADPRRQRQQVAQGNAIGYHGHYIVTKRPWRFS